MATCGVIPKAVLGKSEYCLMVQHLWKVHQQEYERYYAQPHLHPLYHKEWITFISTRSRSVVELGADPKDYDFYLEWKGAWMSRLQELEVEEWNTKKQDSLKASFIHAKSHSRGEHKHTHHPNVLDDDYSPTCSTKSGSRSPSPSTTTSLRSLSLSTSPTRSTESGSRFRSSFTRLRSRSPSTRFRSRSPSRRLRSRSPSKRFKSRKSSKRLKSRSPKTRLKSRSPNTRLRSRSPSRRLKSRSPSTSLESRSPSKRFKSRKSSKRLKSRSPKTRLRSRSPSRRLRSRSPSRRLRSRSPSKRFRSRSPSERFRSQSPSTSLKSESPSTRLISYVKLRTQCGLGSSSPFVKLRSMSPDSKLGSHQLSDSKTHHHQHDEKISSSLEEKLIEPVKDLSKIKSKKSESKKKHKKSSKKKKKKKKISHEADEEQKKMKEKKVSHEADKKDKNVKEEQHNSDETLKEKKDGKDKKTKEKKHDSDKTLKEKKDGKDKKTKEKKHDSDKTLKEKKDGKDKKTKEKKHDSDKTLKEKKDGKDKKTKEKKHDSDKTLKEKKDGKDKKTKEKKLDSDKTLKEKKDGKDKKTKEKKLDSDKTLKEKKDGKDKKTKEKKLDSEKTRKKGDDGDDELKAEQKLVNDKVVNNSEAHVSVLDNDTNINSNLKSQCCSVPITNEDKSIVPSETITKKDDNIESSKMLKMNIEKFTDKNKNTDTQDSAHKNMLLLKQDKETVTDKKMKKKEELKNERNSCKKTTTSTTISSPENSNDFPEKYLRKGKKFASKSETASTKHYEKIRSWERNSHDSREKAKRRDCNESKRREWTDLKRSSKKISLDKRSDSDELKRSLNNRSLYKRSDCDELKRRFNEKINRIEIKRSSDKRSNSDELKRQLHPEKNNMSYFSHKHRDDNDDDGISNNVKGRRNQRREECSSWRKDEKSRNETFPCGSKEHQKKKNNVMTNYKDVVDICSESLDSEDTMNPSRFSQFGKDIMSSAHNNSTSGKNRNNIKSQLKPSSEIYVSSESRASSIFDETKITPKNIKGSLRKCFDLSDIKNTSTSSIITWIESSVHKYGKKNIACSESYDAICYDSDEREEDLSIIKELEEAGEDVLILSDNADERSGRKGDSNASHMNMNIELNLNKSGSSSIEVGSVNVNRKSTQKIVPLFNDVNNSDDDSLSSDDSDLCKVYEEIDRFLKSSESNNDERTSASFNSHTETSNDTNTEMNINGSDTDTSLEINIDWSDNINNIIDVNNVQILSTLHLLNASGEVLGNMTQEVSCLYNTARELDTQKVNLKRSLLHIDTKNLLMDVHSRLKSTIAAGSIHMVKEAIYLELMDMITKILK
ncbi:hypothetical protein Pmani_018930 [Petrolisthes manimaculis]|uniref:Uncharacterized protein n=1 Tax=Petrolisthes manimaculis TaxID=1843537 RepID=A0AAE1PJB0_9EUCA|nr:hypothetical protein Pmani_018930 [Petrolisthes manimaculis]